MNHEPLEYVDALGSGKHIVLFYDEPEYGRAIQFRFINNGLLKGEHCIFTTHGDTKFIENELADSGIDVEGFLRKNLLHIYQILNPMDDPEGVLKGAEKIRDRIFADAKPPYRIVSRFVPDVNTEEGMAAELTLERDFHVSFDKFRCSLLCSYHVEETEANRRAEWIASLLQNHHSAIFVPQFGKGIGFNMR